MAEEAKSGAELIKEKSNYLRGTLAEELCQPTDHFSKDNVNLTKFHGFYEQDNRDTRQEREKSGLGKEYSFMVRTKLPAGRLTAQQYLVIDELATKYGNNTMRITTRQGIQLHGVLKKNLKTTIRSVNNVLITTLGACGDVVRNVMGCPAPTDDRTHGQVWRYAKEVSDHFLSQSGAYHEIWLNGDRLKFSNPENPEPVYGKYYLPRKFKIAISFPHDNCVDLYTNDLGIVPELKDSALVGFNVLVGGGLGFTFGQTKTHPLLAQALCFVKPEDLVKVCEAIVLVQRDFGDRKDRKHARMKYVIESWGIEKFAKEVEKRFGKKLEKAHDIQWNDPDFHLGWHKQDAQKWFIGLSIENGRVKDEGAMRLKSGLKAIVERFHPEVKIGIIPLNVVRLF
jgi:sulfite reductase (ferredoxin)